MSKNPFSQFLDTDGDGGGTINAVGNYSAASEDFYFEHPDGSPTDAEVHRMIVHITDSANPSADVYGNLAAALPNGIQILQIDDAGNTFRDWTAGNPVKSNAEWSRFCYDVGLDNFGSGDDTVKVRWTFAKSGGPLVLKPGWKLVARLNDSFVGLNDHTFMAQGVL